MIRAYDQCCSDFFSIDLCVVSEVHKQWGNEKRECMCLSLGLRFSLGTIKDDEHEGSPSLHIAFLLRDRRFYICKTKSGEEKFILKN